MIDLFMSRRTNYIKCDWYAQNEDEDFVDLDQLTHYSFPAGSFYAREQNSYSEENQVMGNAFLVDSQNVSLVTTDDVKALKQNDYVVYDGKVWRVDSIQRTPRNTQRLYRNRARVSESTIITLRG